MTSFFIGKIKKSTRDYFSGEGGGNLPPNSFKSSFKISEASQKKGGVNLMKSKHFGGKVGGQFNLDMHEMSEIHVTHLQK